MYWRSLIIYCLFYTSDASWLVQVYPNDYGCFLFEPCGACLLVRARRFDSFESILMIMDVSFLSLAGLVFPFWALRGLSACESETLRLVRVYPDYGCFLFEPCGACLLWRRDASTCSSLTRSSLSRSGCLLFSNHFSFEPWGASLAYLYHVWFWGGWKREQACSICVRWPWWRSGRDETKEWALMKLFAYA